MPNLRQLISLKEKYDTLNAFDVKVKKYIDKGLLENIAIKKAFSLNVQKIYESFDVSNAMPSIIDYFESKPSEEVVLLFIDIASFSNITEKRSNNFITGYLDNYYKKLFPIIYSYGGQIEKTMGDGIICVFGKPFVNLDWTEEFNRAELCAKEIIETFKGTNKEVKVALHSGQITYYKTPGTDYEEYTMIGKPLTELYRLESVSRKNAINFYKDSLYDGIRPSNSLGISKINKNEVEIYGFDVSLQGVEYERVHFLKII
jgi:class 3 adenylate cyclase